MRVVVATTGTFYGQHMTAGDIYTVAGTVAGVQFSGLGGPATKAGLGTFIDGIRVDAEGNLVIAGFDHRAGARGGGQHRHVLWSADDRRPPLFGRGQRLRGRHLR